MVSILPASPSRNWRTRVNQTDIRPLTDAGIDVVVDLPGVGREFSDHPDINLGWQPTHKLNEPGQRDLFQSVLNFSSSGGSYVGDLEIMPVLKPLGEMMLTSETTQAAGVLGILRRPIQTLKALRGASIKRFLQQTAHQNDLGFGIAVQQEEARGSITVTSADPRTNPRIDYNYLSTDSDLSRMREVARVTVDLLHTNAFKPYFKRLTELDAATLADDKALNRWLRGHLATAIHASGSAPMGTDPAAGAVVDQYGRVLGVDGLRVADTSIFPYVPSRGPAATAVMTGERIAALIDPSLQPPTAPATGPEDAGPDEQTV